MAGKLTPVRDYPTPSDYTVVVDVNTCTRLGTTIGATQSWLAGWIEGLPLVQENTQIAIARTPRKHTAR
jgi:hypothetical protein